VPQMPKFSLKGANHLKVRIFSHFLVIFLKVYAVDEILNQQKVFSLKKHGLSSKRKLPSLIVINCNNILCFSLFGCEHFQDSRFFNTMWMQSIFIFFLGFDRS